MKRRIAARMLVTVFAATLVVSISATAQVGGAACSLARAAGTYGVSDSGTIAGAPRAAVGQLTLDAAGNISATVTVNVNGTVSNSTLTGTYAVNPKCTGSTSFNETDENGNLITVTVALVWDANMQEIRFLFTEVTVAGGTVPTVISGTARKVVP